MCRLATILKNARIKEGMTQLEFAAKLGISQSFLSRLESGRRRDVSRSTWDQLIRSIPELNNAMPTPWSYDLRLEYDQALMSYAEGDHDDAELRLNNVLRKQYSSEQRVEYEIQVAAMLRLGNIRRDRGNIYGPEGALPLYESLLCETSVPAELLMETQFMKAACYEMTNSHQMATTCYLRLFEEFSGVDKVRCASRLGAIMTKVEEYEQARTFLQYATTRSTFLDSGVQYSYSHEKLGLLLARQGNLDSGRREILKARTEIRPTHSLRKVQSMVAEAQVFALDRSPEEALAILSKARQIALEYDFRHQIAYIDQLSKGK